MEGTKQKILYKRLAALALLVLALAALWCPWFSVADPDLREDLHALGGVNSIIDWFGFGENTTVQKAQTILQIASDAKFSPMEIGSVLRILSTAAEDITELAWQFGLPDIELPGMGRLMVISILYNVVLWGLAVGLVAFILFGLLGTAARFSRVQSGLKVGVCLGYCLFALAMIGVSLWIYYDNILAFFGPWGIMAAHPTIWLCCGCAAILGAAYLLASGKQTGAQSVMQLLSDKENADQ